MRNFPCVWHICTFVASIAALIGGVTLHKGGLSKGILWHTLFSINDTAILNVYVYLLYVCMRVHGTMACVEGLPAYRGH